MDKNRFAICSICGDFILSKGGKVLFDGTNPGNLHVCNERSIIVVHDINEFRLCTFLYCNSEHESRINQVEMYCVGLQM